MRPRVPVLVFSVLITSACGGSSSPTSPSSRSGAPTAPTSSASVPLTGQVTALNGGQALGGLIVDIGSQTTGTDGAGRFAFSSAPSGTQRLSITGSAIVPRSLMVAVNRSREVSVNAISLNGFDLGFYRQLVRDGFESPSSLQPLRRWTKNPHLFIQTTSLVDGATLDMVERTVRDAVSLWTAGRYLVDQVERGAGTRNFQSGWLTVKWSPDNDGKCGVADVAVDGGFIQFSPNTPGCRCGAYGVSPKTVRHETGHAMGFWHTGEPSDVMSPGGTSCDRPITARELAAAAVAYQRPVGNMDPDSDPAGLVTLAPMRAIP